MEKPMLAERDRIAANVIAIKTGAAEMSQLLAEEMLSGGDWEQAVRVLAECRAERKRLDDRLADRCDSRSHVGL
jgi:hypothetical protein